MQKISEKAGQIVKKAFPDARIEKLQIYKHGLINKTYEIIISTPDEKSKELILRLSPKESWKPKKEKFVYELISGKTFVPVPKVYLIESSEELIGSSFMLLSKIKGEDLDKVYSKTRNKSLISNAGEYLGEIHSIKMPAFGWIMDNGIEPKFSKWTDFLEYDLNEKLSSLAMVRHFPKQVINQSRRFFSTKRNILDTEEKPCLLHKDYHYSHIIADDKNINGIIDVEWAIAGRPELDLVKSCMWMFPKEKETEKIFLNGYRKKAKISSGFEERKTIYEFLILVSSLSLAYEYHNLKWVEEHLARLRGILK